MATMSDIQVTETISRADENLLAEFVDWFLQFDPQQRLDPFDFATGWFCGMRLPEQRVVVLRTLACSRIKSPFTPLPS
jgi:hypothetical protein